jgi:anti-sigma regulatory factor (Ser/Thr protein kinase)
MEVGEARVVEVTETSQVGQARREAIAMAKELKLSDNDCGRVGIVVTEAANNLAKHAQHGRLLLQEWSEGGERAFLAVALDDGPGVEHLGDPLRDGYSTSGTPGTGLGAMARQSSTFDIHSEPGRGTAVLMAVWPKNEHRPGSLRSVGGVSVPYPGETVCGDGWAVADHHGQRTILVSDGLGHGAGASEASQMARTIFHQSLGLAPAEMVQRMHESMRATRGAAIAVCTLDPEAGTARFCGIGNIAGRIFEGALSRGLVSLYGTVGSEVRKIQEFSYPWPAGAVLVLSSDGLGTHWDLSELPGLALRDPALIAAILYRDHARGRDDVTVVVARNES